MANPLANAFEMPENQAEFLANIKEKDIFKHENFED